jgi:hypothetical protein
VTALLCALPGRVALAREAAPLVVLDVPFLAQTEALCGGAAAAMVMRYWGAPEVHPESFEDLVDPTRGGITTGDLVGRIRSLGFQALPFRGEVTTVQHHLERGRPVMALIETSRGRFHYVVLVAWRGDRVMLHDPALGPFRVVTRKELEEEWSASEDWALLVLPGTARSSSASDPRDRVESADATTTGDGCDRLVDEAVARARDGAYEEAEQRLSAAAALCPERGRPVRELAAVRFRQERWHEAVRLGGRATRLSPGDDQAWRLLATSRFLDGDPTGALRAWNRIGEPVVEDVTLDGLERTRQDVVRAWLDIRIGELLTPARLLRARRRLEELPAAALSRVSFRPLGEGQAGVEAAVLERPLMARPWQLALQAAADAVTERETRLRLNSVAKMGGSLELGVRWWERRPAVGVAARAPRALGLPGLVGAELSWAEQPYALSPDVQPFVESALRGGLTHADWLTSSLRLELEVAGEKWNDRGSFISLAARLDQRLLRDRVSLALDGRGGVSVSDEPGFGAGSATVAVRTSASPERVVARGRFSLWLASETAPLGYWPGAGVGHARRPLLRAHPLLQDGVISGPAFGRRLLHGGVEMEVRVAALGPLRLGVAGFVDWARAWDHPSAPGAGPSFADVGGGLRLRFPGNLPALRFDAATSLDDGGLTLSAGWQLPWPR